MEVGQLVFHSCIREAAFTSALGAEILCLQGQPAGGRCWVYRYQTPDSLFSRGHPRLIVDIYDAFEAHISNPIEIRSLDSLER